MARNSDAYDARGNRERRGDRPAARQAPPPRPDLPPMQAGARIGRLVRKVDDKGFAFIQDSLSLVDCFLHRSEYHPEGEDPPFEQLLAHPQAGTLMRFTATQGEKGWRALDATVAPSGAGEGF
jgi:cold shock CspA family protein